ncbi:MAG TPA: FAD-dependent oxidoreductase [Acidimicrobiia bacterium]|jgi:D-arginine dehydrogenase
MRQRVDVVVIGGGIAGVSVAAELSTNRAVTLLEGESTLAYHTTGRSAALFFGSYGHPDTLPLTRLSHEWFENPPTDHPVLSLRGALTVAFSGDLPELEGGITISGSEAVDLVPVLDGTRLIGAVWEPDAADMDVAAIHQAYVRILRSNGGEIVTSARVTLLERGSPWRITTAAGTWEADIVVNAAGAWGDEVAMMAGLAPVGLVPKRRTAFMVTAPPNSERWPLVTDAGHHFYFKPDGLQLLCSPADETPSEPCDARPQDVDIALAIERINEATTLGIRSIRSSWAGLRTFAPDGSMVIGPDPDDETFFWLVGQGGTGIQTAPAAAQLAAGLIDGDPPMSGDPFDPARFR